MASINISEDDFNVLAAAANDANARGDQEQADALDKIARKVNAALSKNQWATSVVRLVGVAPKPLSWRDMPSTLVDQ